MTAPRMSPPVPPNPLGGEGAVRAPGAMPVTLPQSVLGFMDQATFAAQTQGVTPEAQQALADEIKVREINDKEKRKKALKAIFGDAFPLAKDVPPEPNQPDPESSAINPTMADDAWYRWCVERWEYHRPGIQHNIWMAERNRQFRAGFQWQSRINSMGAWREQPIPKDAVRIVDNRIRPSLAWASEVVAEQRPGWNFKPTNTDADRERKADAQQRAVEFQYDAQNKGQIDRETMYWAQTDGVCFQMTYWNPDKGPWEELESGQGPVPLGEPDTKVYRLEQVRVSSEATSTVAPMYWIVRDVIPMQQAVALYGPEVTADTEQGLLAMQMSQFTPTNQYAYQPLYQNQTTVARYTVFCEKSQWLPNGLTVVVVGKKLVYGPMGLLMGRVPMVRYTDGSDDPSFFPTPKMNLLIGPQMRINMLWSKWYESIRKNAGGRYASKTNALSAETFIGGETSILEIRAPGPIGESFMAVPSFSVGNDIKEALDREVAIIEDLTGYTKEARGQFSSDQSGRAILAQREQLERVFAPQVTAMAEGNTEWAKQQVGWMRFGYQMPRKISILGKNRSDLAMELSAVDLDGVVDVTVDRESLIPQPKALRQWLLDNAFDRQIITKDQYLERMPFGDIRDMQAPSEIQYQKAKRVSEQLRLGQPAEPVVWQDDEAIQQNVLERDLILAGGIEDQVRALAMQRWQQLAQQQQQKRGPQPPVPGSAEANYQKFIQETTDSVKRALETALAKIVQQAEFMGGPMAPQVAPALPAGPQEGEPGKSPPKGQPQNPRTAPLFTSLPSVAAAPLGQGAQPSPRPIV